MHKRRALNPQYSRTPVKNAEVSQSGSHMFLKVVREVAQGGR